jgi:hypothetical protein
MLGEGRARVTAKQGGARDLVADADGAYLGVDMKGTCGSRAGVDAFTDAMADATQH